MPRPLTAVLPFACACVLTNSSRWDSTLLSSAGGTPLRDALREGHRKVAALLHDRGATLGRHVEASVSQMEADLQALLAKGSPRLRAAE